MAQTYNNLLDDVLLFTDAVGASDATNVAKVGLRFALSYISRKANLNGLVRSKSYTWLESDVAVSLTDVGGFNISDFQYPYYMMVGTLTETPVPYHYMDFKDWQILKAVAVGGRVALDAAFFDGRFDRAFTLDYDNKIQITPTVSSLPVTLYYYKEPAAFGDGSGSPEISSAWTDMMTHAAIEMVRFYLENPDKPVPMVSILQSMDREIDMFKIHLEGSGYRRNIIKVHPSYNTRQTWRLRG